VCSFLVPCILPGTIKHKSQKTDPQVKFSQDVGFMPYRKSRAKPAD